jgi:hypothetical protein
MIRISIAAGLVTGLLFAASAAAAPRSPDKIAWQVFAAMAAPAPGTKEVAFETWASDADIYSPTPLWPKRAMRVLQRSLAASAEAFAAHGTTPPVADCEPKDGKAGNFPPGACIGEEVQHNWPVFKYLTQNGLTSTAGLAKAYTNGNAIDFPPDAIVVKADWVALGDVLRWQPRLYKTAQDVRRAYYTDVAEMNGRRQEYALAGMSVQSKALPHWLWMTFEHRSNPGRCDIIGCHDNFGSTVADIAPRGSPNTDYGPCAKTAALKALLAARHVDPVFENYCLKGTQVDFVAGATPTILANSVIERMNKGVAVQNTSCITCHAYAAFDAHGTPNYAVLPQHPVGMIDPAWLKGFKSHDYLWGILAAH